MAAQLGMQARVSFGEEVTAGTEEARTVSARISSTTLQGKVTRDVVEHLYGSAGTVANVMDQFDVSKDVGGEIVFPACYQGGALGLLLKHAMGANVDAGAGPYTHTLTLTGALPVGLSVAVERGAGGLGDQEFYGNKIASLELSCQVGQVMQGRATLIGMSYGARGSDSPPALTTPYYIKHNHAGSLGFNSATYVMRSFRLSINNNLEAIRELSSLTATEVNRSAMQVIELECEMVARSDAPYAAHLAGTQGDVTVTFSDGTRSLAVTLHNGVIMEYDDPISGPGYITQRMKWRGFGDGTKHGLGIVLTNGVSTVEGG
jgi:hypothetical protein